MKTTGVGMDPIYYYNFVQIIYVRSSYHRVSKTHTVVHLFTVNLQHSRRFCDYFNVIYCYVLIFQILLNLCQTF